MSVSASIFGRKFDEFRARRRQQAFAAKVHEALAELGMSEANLNERVKLLLAQVCAACYAQDQERANPHGLALEFFLRFALEYPQLVDGALKFKNVFVRAIAVIRAWHLVNRIPTAQADDGIARIKAFLVAELRRMDDSDDEDRVLAELEIREL